MRSIFWALGSFLRDRIRRVPTHQRKEEQAEALRALSIILDAEEAPLSRAVGPHALRALRALLLDDTGECQRRIWMRIWTIDHPEWIEKTTFDHLVEEYEYQILNKPRPKIPCLVIRPDQIVKHSFELPWDAYWTIQFSRNPNALPFDIDEDLVLNEAFSQVTA